MSERRKTIFTVLMCVSTLVFAAYIWETYVVLTFLLATLAFVMMWLEHKKSAVVIFFFAFALGPLAEAVLISAGAWTYEQQHILGFPIWLPFLWGNAALMFNRMNLFFHHISN